MILRLALVLSMLAPPPSEEAARAAFNDGDLARALELYLERAEAPGVHAPDALAGAHDSLRGLYRKTDDLAHICRALDLARAVLARDDLADERAFWVELEAEDVELAGVACAEVARDESTRSDTGVGVSESSAADEQAPAPVVKPEGPTPLPGTKNSPPWRPVTRIAIGAGLVAVGVGLLGGMAVALARREQADGRIADITALVTAEGRGPTPAEHQAVAAADHRYVRLEKTAAVLGTVGFVSAITGLAVMLARPRAASRTRVHAGAGGLVYSF